MKRMHIHVVVEDLNDSIRFYGAMFGNKQPTVLKSDYCKWELTDLAVNFAISQRGGKPGVDHIGIQVGNRRGVGRDECPLHCRKAAGTGTDGDNLLLRQVGQGVDSRPAGRRLGDVQNPRSRTGLW